MIQKVCAIILAAGKGSRMKSPLPKVLHLVNGVPMLERVINTIADLGIEEKVIVLGNDLNPFQKLMSRHTNLKICQQKEQLGTAHAVASCAKIFSENFNIPYVKENEEQPEKLNSDYALITTGDTPAINAKELRDFIEFSLTKRAKFSVLGIEIPEPYGYGRLVTTDEGSDLLEKIVEERDATDSEKKINLCNSGIIFAHIPTLFETLSKIDNVNSQNEYYLTDCVKHLCQDSQKVLVFKSKNWQQFLGVNTPEQLGNVEKILSSL